MNAGRGSTPVLWGQVCSLALVQGAISLTWVVYNLYLGQLLTGLGFAASLAAGLLILENLLGVAMEPLMGSLCDRLQQQIGTRFPFISLGTLLAAGCFLTIPTVIFWGQGPVLRWILPVLLVAWALAMTVFRSPALSLLGRYAIGTRLPQAASVLTLVGGLAAAMGPLASGWILGLGPMVAFALGSVVLLGAAAVLRWVGPGATVTPGTEAAVEPSGLGGIPWGALGWVFGTGAAITVGFRLVLGSFPVALAAQGNPGAVPWVMGCLFLALAGTALPAGALGVRLGNRRAMLVGLGGMTTVAIALALIPSVPWAIAFAMLFGAAHSLVANGTLPFALNQVPPHRAGLGIGCFFGGAALASSLLSLAFPAPPPIALASPLGALAFLGAGLCVGAATKGEPLPRLREVGSENS